jgi:hypothetical protein
MNMRTSRRSTSINNVSTFRKTVKLFLYLVKLSRKRSRCNFFLFTLLVSKPPVQVFHRPLERVREPSMGARSSRFLERRQEETGLEAVHRQGVLEGRARAQAEAPAVALEPWTTWDCGC